VFDSSFLRTLELGSSKC